jgi:hypothetical protein
MSPTSKLEVVGNVEADGFTINGIPVGTSTDSYWLASDGNIYYTLGNVGIDTTDPVEKLDVEGTVQMLGFKMPVGVHSGYVLTSDGSGVGTWQPANSGNGGGIGGSGTTNYIPKFTAPTTLGDSVIYEKNGKIGIGTTNPTSGKLHIKGSGNYNGLFVETSGSSQAANIVLKSDSSTWYLQSDDLVTPPGSFQLWSTYAGGDVFTITKSGNVGIGRNMWDPEHELHVEGRVVADEVIAGRFQDEDDYHYWINPSSAVTSALFAGKVGIGTTSPQGYNVGLHVSKGSADGNWASDAPLVVEDDGSAHINIRTPNDKQSGIIFSDPDAMWTGKISYEHLSNKMKFATAGSTWMTIDPLGRVGIGVTNPAYTLTVNGDVFCNGKLYAAGGIDPPYVLYDKETRESIIERVAREVPEDKLDGAVLFWNGDDLRFEIYLPAKGEFWDLQGNLLTEDTGSPEDNFDQIIKGQQKTD